MDAPSLPAPSGEFFVLLTLTIDAIVVVAALFFATTSDRHIDYHSVVSQKFSSAASPPIS